MGTSPSLTRDARLKPGEPRGTGGEPLEPQLGSDEDSRGKSIPARSVGGCGCPCPRPVLSPGVRLLPTPQRREAAFSSGVRRSWGGECPPLIIPFPPLAAWWEDCIRHANLLREPACPRRLLPPRGPLSCHLLRGEGCRSPSVGRHQSGAGTPLPPAPLQVGGWGGAGASQGGFLCEPVSLCGVFGGGTKLTVLGESPSSLLSFFFPQGLDAFLSLCSFLCLASALWSSLQPDAPLGP